MMRTKRHSAFTLMELMISIALALVLILGINEVFGLTAKTVGAGQALSSDYQNNRGAQIVMTNDFRNMVNNAPLLITSQYTHVFRSRQDQGANQSSNANVFNPVGQNYNVPANILHPRNQRLDTVAFCVRDLFQRQTGGVAGAFISPGTSYEAYVWYGHVNVGNNTMPAPTAWSTNTNPGVGAPSANPFGPPAANPNNYYSSQWVLGRRALLFQQNTGGLAYVSGIEYDSASIVIQGLPVQTSGIDVVSGTAGAAANEGTIDAFTTNIYNKSKPSWWGGTGSSNISGPSWLNYRFQCNPKPVAPLTPNSAAFYSPAFISGCSQFCVEFAGDYVTQDGNPSSPTYGKATSNAGPDGTIDFNIVNGVRQIRWYGMKRSVIGDGVVDFTRGDVVRVQDVPGIPTGVAGSAPIYTFEKMASGNTTTYAAVWHPLETNNPRPKLIRIIWAMDDPNNRLGAPVTFEYVFPVP